MIWQKNPFPVAGRLHRCWLLAYRVPMAAAAPLAPPALELVTHRGFAFWNVVICRLSGMRPAGVPAAFGLGYWHVAYRLLVRAKLRSGEEITGLCFIRSDADHPLVVATGNLLTDFCFHSARVAVEENAQAISFEVATRGAKASFRLGGETPVQLAPGSPFSSLEEAAAFLKYTPVALSPHGAGAVNIVRVARDEQAWRTRLLAIDRADAEFLCASGAVPELAFEVAPLEYRWGRGEVAEVQR